MPLMLLLLEVKSYPSIKDRYGDRCTEHIVSVIKQQALRSQTPAEIGYNLFKLRRGGNVEVSLRTNGKKP